MASSRAAGLLALDVDGTLLRRDGVVDPRDLAAVARLRAAGTVVTIATGRLYSGTRGVAQTLGLAGPVACVDGSHIVDASDHSTLLHQSIRGAHALTLKTIVADHDLASFLFAQDRVVYDLAGEPFASYVRTWSPDVDLVASSLEHSDWEHELGLLALVAVAEEAAIRSAVDRIAIELGTVTRVLSFPVHRLGMHAMLVRAAGTTKGTAVEWLAKRHGVAMADVVVVGDWLNDLPMFEVAGRSFVMGQAPPEVKARATDHLEADCFGGGGVAEAISRAFGI